MARKQAVLEIIAEVSGVEVSSLEPETELVADLGIDSPRALQLLVELEDRLEIEIGDEAIEKLETVGSVLEAVRQYEASIN
ncbi:MAG: phosphopantetheine-binding protein [Thermoanaerobaculia bacterium]